MNDNPQNAGEAMAMLREHWEESAKTQTDWRTPEEKECLGLLNSQIAMLRELGWNDAAYCPKDGSWFLAIQAGSTGVFECRYEGTWPKGVYLIADCGDLWPSHGVILWKPKPTREAAKQACERHHGENRTR